MFFFQSYDRRCENARLRFQNFIHSKFLVLASRDHGCLRLRVSLLSKRTVIKIRTIELIKFLLAIFCIMRMCQQITTRDV